MKKIIQEKHVYQIKNLILSNPRNRDVQSVVSFIEHKGDIPNKAKNGELFILFTLWKGYLFLW